MHGPFTAADALADPKNHAVTVTSRAGWTTPEVTALIDWKPDPAIQQIVSGWPRGMRTDRATRLGLAPDPDFRSLIDQYLAETRP